MRLVELGIEAVERGLVPDALTRLAIRRLCNQRLRESSNHHRQSLSFAQEALIQSMRSEPIALVPRKANEQHYELPPEFFAAILGRQRKYSCCYWADESTTLDAAEVAALAATCEHAEIADGQDILELGCGWGSLSLWMARQYPNSRITAVSNSVSQRQYIEAAATTAGITNLRVITADMNHFAPPAGPAAHGTFDRVVSVEMFEHMRNYELLLARIAGWLRPRGKLFVHVFCHRRLTYPFLDDGPSDWMSRHFFTGGHMPSADLLRQFDRDLQVTKHWAWNGAHYRRTAEAWLANLDLHRQTLMTILERVYGAAEAGRWLQRWRMFFLAVAELFGFSGGEEWFVSHYLLEHAV